MSFTFTSPAFASALLSFQPLVYWFFLALPNLLPMHTMRPATSLLRAAIRSAAPRAQHIPAPASKRLFCTPRTYTATRPSPILSRARIPCAVRCESTAASSQAPESRLERDQVPSYELTFTCNVCKTRSSHRLSKQGYHKGTVLISCPDCKNRHLISDHLKVSREWHGVRSHI
jgi:protein import protein ZIM17